MSQMSSITPLARLRNRDGKVFGIGAHRTGTRSLVAALGVLGYECAHWEKQQEIMADVRSGNFRHGALETMDGAADFPIPSIYPQLDEAFPGSRFILTVRDPEAWLRSVRKHIGERKLAAAEKLFYGTDSFDPDLFLRRYDEHNRSVLEYFRDRDDLLVMDVTAGDGWARLAPFLEMPPPRFRFPHAGRR